jgi:hypothetical protein
MSNDPSKSTRGDGQTTRTIIEALHSAVVNDQSCVIVTDSNTRIYLQMLNAFLLSFGIKHEKLDRLNGFRFQALRSGKDIDILVYPEHETLRTCPSGWPVFFDANSEERDRKHRQKLGRVDHDREVEG